ncbi:TIFY domain protein 8 isoform 1 [Theobroma cacao]|uniref:Protein TIFY n=1 Tax=Theobroma cacao TaxID=3641 RepID=A0A061GPP4_THECC|nr:TIFY domain protein 8 isoform 1 [Theobroma cacao]
MAVLKMAQQSKTTNTNNANTNNTSTHLQHQQQVKPTMFHDFLGMKATDSPVVLAHKATDARFSEASPSASASVGASSGGGGGAGRGPISSTSDLGSGVAVMVCDDFIYSMLLCDVVVLYLMLPSPVERQVGNHLEGIPYYGPRSEISGPEISNRLVGSKRGNSDSAFMGHESLESLHLMKMLRNGAGGERSRRSNEDEVFLGMQSMRPSSASLILQPPTGSRLEGNASKWERSVPMIGSAVQYGPRGGHFVPFVHQASSNRFKDTNVGPSVISQSAADEGSRTGIKGPGILSSINTSGIPTEKNSSGVVPSGARPKSGAHISDPESSVPPSRQGLTSASRQMTIFYAGQAHVFDDVHPNKVCNGSYDKESYTLLLLTGLCYGWVITANHCDELHLEQYFSGTISFWIVAKHVHTLVLVTFLVFTGFFADVIMALAGSNGGSWSTTYSPKSAVRPVSENYAPGEEPEAVGSMVFSREFRGRIAVAGNTSQGTGSGERISIQTGVPQGTIVIAKDARNPVQAAEPSAEDKREV